MPKIETISELTAFFENEGEFGLIEFDIELEEVGRFSSHDDGECNIILYIRLIAYNLIKTAAPTIYQDLLLATLINNQNFYIIISENGEIQKFKTLKQYQESYN